jgi:hypothetical protein
MKRLILPFVMLVSVVTYSQESGGLLKKAGGLFGKSKSGAGLSNEDIVS